MRAGQKNQITGRALWLLPALLLLALVTALSTTLARYVVQQEGALGVASAAEISPVLLCDRYGQPLVNGDWVRQGDTCRLDFTLCNAQSEVDIPQNELSTTLRVVSTVDLHGESTVVRLLAGGDTYIGTAEPIIKNTVFWRQYGDGDLYRFYNQAGEELVWTLEGGRLSQMEMTLLVTGAAEGTVFTLTTARAAAD